MASRWEVVSREEFSVIPGLPGVYAIYVDGVLKYIGQSLDLYQRIQQHQGKKGKLYGLYSRTKLSVKFKVCPSPEEYLGLEMRLITRLKPEWNTTHNSLESNWLVQKRRASYYKPGDCRRMNIKNPKTHAHQGAFAESKGSPWKLQSISGMVLTGEPRKSRKDRKDQEVRSLYEKGMVYAEVISKVADMTLDEAVETCQRLGLEVRSNGAKSEAVRKLLRSKAA